MHKAWSTKIELLRVGNEIQIHVRRGEGCLFQGISFHFNGQWNETKRESWQARRRWTVEMRYVYNIKCSTPWWSDIDIWNRNYVVGHWYMETELRNTTLPWYGNCQTLFKFFGRKLTNYEYAEIQRDKGCLFQGISFHYNGRWNETRLLKSLQGMIKGTEQWQRAMFVKSSALYARFK